MRQARKISQQGTGKAVVLLWLIWILLRGHLPLLGLGIERIRSENYHYRGEYSHCPTEGGTDLLRRMGIHNKRLTNFAGWMSRGALNSVPGHT